MSSPEALGFSSLRAAWELMMASGQLSKVADSNRGVYMRWLDRVDTVGELSRESGNRKLLSWATVC